MDSGLKTLIALAWRTVPAREANEAILRARAATAAGQALFDRGGVPEDAPEAPPPGDDPDSLPLSRSYEILLGPDATFEQFAQTHLPRLVYHLESIGARLPRAAGVLICLFEGESLHFLQAGELIEECCRQLGLTPAQLSQKFGTHELQTAVQSEDPPLLLS